MLNNLLSNALKYGNNKQDIEIKTALNEANGQFMLSISNGTNNFRAEDVSKLTERFFRGNQRGKQAIKGTGLGLSIVQEVCDRHNFKLLNYPMMKKLKSSKL